MTQTPMHNFRACSYSSDSRVTSNPETDPVPNIYEIWQRTPEERTILSPSLQPKAWANSGRLDGPAMARNRARGSGFVGPCGDVVHPLFIWTSL